MHGVKRKALTAEARAQRKAKEQVKLAAYLQLEADVFARASGGECCSSTQQR